MDRDPEDPAAARAERARQRRARITITCHRLGDEPPERIEGTPASRIGLVTRLSEEAWLLSGRPLPDLPRSEWPVRVRRLGDEADD